MYKTKGLRVLANDRLRYCHHAARTIIENGKVCLTDDGLEALLVDNAKAGTFVRDNFKGIFFVRKPLEDVDGVAIIIGRLKKEFVPEGGNPRSMVLQAYRFARKTEKNPDGWTM